MCDKIVLFDAQSVVRSTFEYKVVYLPSLDLFCKLFDQYTLPPIFYYFSMFGYRLQIF